MCGFVKKSVNITVWERIICLCINIWHNTPTWWRLLQLGKGSWSRGYKQELLSESSFFPFQTEHEPKHSECTEICRYFQVSERAESAASDDEGQLLNDFQSSQVKTLEVCALEQSDITRCFNTIKCLNLPQSNIFKLAQNFFPLHWWIYPVTLNPSSIASASAEWYLSPKPFSTGIDADGHLGSSEEPATGFGPKHN